MCLQVLRAHRVLRAPRVLLARMVSLASPAETERTERTACRDLWERMESQGLSVSGTAGGGREVGSCGPCKPGGGGWVGRYWAGVGQVVVQTVLGQF